MISTTLNQVSFIGKISGDGECFCWDELSKEDLAKIFKKNTYKTSVYPQDIFDKFSCEWGEKYKFTIIIENVK